MHLFPQVWPVLETDVGLGAILSQQQDDGKIHLIAYASRSLDQHEKNYRVTELETLGLASDTFTPIF